MGKDLKAENLTISIPDRGCNKNCPYCVAKMTGSIEENPSLMMRNINKVINLAKSAEITSILFTGKGEPLMEGARDIMFNLARKLNDWPLELQTNGIKLIEEQGLIEILFKEGFNVIAVSVDSNQQLEHLTPIFKKIALFGMISRMTVNVTGLLKISDFKELHEYCHLNSVKQLTLRKIISPEEAKDKSVAEWISKNAKEEQYKALVETAIKYIHKNGRLIRTTNDGVQIWDCNSISFAHSDYCLQERNKSSDIRSLIFQEDGHLYTSWNSRASILF